MRIVEGGYPGRDRAQLRERKLAAGGETADRDQRWLAIARLAGDAQRGDRDAGAGRAGIGRDRTRIDPNIGLDPRRDRRGRDLLELATRERGLRERGLAGGEQKHADES